MASCNGDQVNEFENRNENETAATQSNAIDASNDHQIDGKQSTVATHTAKNALNRNNNGNNKKKRKSPNQTSLNVVSEIDSSSNCVTSDASNIEYRIIQNENKRKKIEILKHHQRAQSGNVVCDNEMLSNVDLKTPSSSVITNTNNIPTEKPPLPPKPKNIKKMSIQSNDCCKCSNNQSKSRMKFENIHATTVQRLTAQSEYLRLEISQLKAALASEQNAVRALR